MFGDKDEIALVLASGVIDDDDRTPGLEFGNRSVDRVEPSFHRPAAGTHATHRQPIVGAVLQPLKSLASLATRIVEASE